MTTIYTVHVHVDGLVLRKGFFCCVTRKIQIFLEFKAFLDSTTLYVSS